MISKKVVFTKFLLEDASDMTEKPENPKERFRVALMSFSIEFLFLETIYSEN